MIYQFLKQKNIKVIGLIIDELGGKSMTKFVGLKAKSYLCYKRKHKELVKNKELKLEIQQRFESERYNVFTDEINKIALSSNDDKKCNQLIR